MTAPAVPLKATDRSPYKGEHILLSIYPIARANKLAQHHVGGALTMLCMFVPRQGAEDIKVLPGARLM
jgi:hypothetical protein